MEYSFVILQADKEKQVSDYLLLEEALQHWHVMGYKHPEYQIVMCKGPEISILEEPIEVMYFFLSDEDLQADLNELLDGFSINTFLFRRVS
jgi:hypothetical protein